MPSRALRRDLIWLLDAEGELKFNKQNALAGIKTWQPIRLCIQLRTKFNKQNALAGIKTIR